MALSRRSPSPPPPSYPASHLLPFHRNIITELITDEGDGLLILARGLGLRRIVCAILKIYDQPSNLVIVVNAGQEEENAIQDELSLLGVRRPGLRIVHHEMPAKQRQEIYRAGGLLSVTSRILVVDMLSKRIPIDLVTGLIVLHAERVSPTSVEAFIVRIYRQENKDGFVKGFSDDPEHFTFGLSPLQTVLRQLAIRKVFLWPRFHEQVAMNLGQRKADVIELHQPLSRSMRDIQTAIVECLDATLSELKRSNTTVDVDDFTVENAIFRAFDAIVRVQLDPVWHRVGPKTKQLVGDLKTLRSLLHYLLSYDPVTFNSFLESILTTNTISSTGNTRQNQSPWLFMDAANTIFGEAKRRVYVVSDKPEAQPRRSDSVDPSGGPNQAANESEGRPPSPADGTSASNAIEVAEETATRKPWMPPNVQPVLEEPPKWGLLKEVLDEIEEEIHFSDQVDLTGASNNTILIMTSSDRTTSQLREYLSTMPHDAESSTTSRGRPMMERLLKNYFFWKGGLGQMTANLKSGGPGSVSASGSIGAASGGVAGEGQESEALKRKAIFQRGRQPPNKRRRVRGGSVAANVTGARTLSNGSGPGSLEQEAGEMANFINSALERANSDLGLQGEEEVTTNELPTNITENLDEFEFDNFFGLLSMESLVVIRSYQGDDDDRVLQELRPRFIVMYDPDPGFVRRVEVYRSTHPGVGVRVYFLMYADSVEEQLYLSNLRREKEAFEKLIREKSVMAMPLQADGRPAGADDVHLLRTISSRIAGGQKIAAAEPPRIIVDMREFRSSLPSMLHAANIQVIPCTLQVGDYILTPTMCVERKSIPDLIQSFNSGRLYTQCELMSVHYKHPILLIEFEQNKSFSLQTMSENRPTTAKSPTEVDIQSKLVLLTLAFPRLRIIWSSSPYATSDIFADLKSNHEEPDANTVALVGMEDEETAAGSTPLSRQGSTVRAQSTRTPGGGENAYNLVPQDVLRALPGINTKNYKYVMSRLRDVGELCDLRLEEVQELVGVEPGRQLYNFIRRDIKTRGDGGGRAA